MHKDENKDSKEKKRDAKKRPIFGRQQEKSKQQSLVKAKEDKISKADKVKQALKVRFALEQEPKVDMYYYRIYRKLRLIRYICVLLAALFVMSAPMVYSDQITTENFKYLLKYIDLQLSEDSETYTEFRFDPSDNMQFGNYQDDIVTCSDTALVFYDKLGKESLRISFGPYKNPQLLISDKYVMVYDRGGNEYAIYNSFKQLHRETTQYPITLCALKDSGAYAVLTSNHNYTGELLVYNRNFKQTNRVQRDLYISDVFFTDTEGEFGYTGFTTNTNGSCAGEICVYDAKSKKIVNIETDQMPLSASVQKETVRVLFANGVTCYSQKGVVLGQYQFEDNAPGMYALDDRYVAVSFLPKDKKQNGVTAILSRDGKEIKTVSNKDEVRKLQWHDGKLYIISDKVVKIINATNGKEIAVISVSKGLQKILFLPNQEMMGCYHDRVKLLVVG